MGEKCSPVCDYQEREPGWQPANHKSQEINKTGWTMCIFDFQYSCKRIKKMPKMKFDA